LFPGESDERRWLKPIPKRFLLQAHFPKAPHFLLQSQRRFRSSSEAMTILLPFKLLPPFPNLCCIVSPCRYTRNRAPVQNRLVRTGRSSYPADDDNVWPSGYSPTVCRSRDEDASIGVSWRVGRLFHVNGPWFPTSVCLSYPDTNLLFQPDGMTSKWVRKAPLKHRRTQRTQIPFSVPVVL